MAVLVPPQVTQATQQHFLTAVSEAFANGNATMEANLQTAMDALVRDPSNPANLAKYQSNMQTYMLYRSAQASTTKSFKDTDESIIGALR
jgi:type III secretion protein F